MEVYRPLSVVALRSILILVGALGGLRDGLGLRHSHASKHKLTHAHMPVQFAQLHLSELLGHVRYWVQGLQDCDVQCLINDDNDDSFSYCADVSAILEAQAEGENN